MEIDSAIVTRNIGKSFGETEAVRGIDLDVPPGQVFSLLGPNGAGKTTLISMLCCLLRPTRGEAWIVGHSTAREPLAVKRAIGVVPQEIALYLDLSAEENLAFWGRMYGLGGGLLRERVDEALEVVGLVDQRQIRPSAYSGGMKRRLNIAAALLHHPRVLILDEPTVGIDPQSRRQILETVKGFGREGRTVLYTTHYMEEAQEVSDRIAIMDRGQLIAQGTYEELVRLVGELDRIDVSLGGDRDRVVERWRSLEGVRQVSSDDGRAVLLVEDADRALPRLFDSAAQLQARICAVEIQEPSLEAVFLQLTGRALRDEVKEP